MISSGPNTPLCFFSFFKYVLKKFSIYLAASVLSCGMLGLFVAAFEISFFDQGSSPGPSALGACSLTHWTMREIPSLCF